MCLLCGLNRVLVIILFVSDCCFKDDACRILTFTSSNSAHIQSKEQSSDDVSAKLPLNFTHSLLYQFRGLIGSRATS